MKLGEWLDREELKPSEFAGRIKRTSETVRRYVAGDRIPDRDTMPLIVEHTRGEVTPNDFFDVAQQPEAANLGSRYELRPDLYPVEASA